MIKGLLTVFLILGAMHLAYLFSSPTIKNRMLEGKMREIAQDGVMKPESQIRREVMAFVDEKGIPLSADAVVIQKENNRVTIAAHYTDSVQFWFYRRDYEFYPASRASARLKPRHQRAARRTARASAY